MKAIVMTLIVGVLSFLFGCQTAGLSQQPDTDIRTPEQLVSAIRAAHSTSKLSALEGISYLERVDAVTRESIADSFKELLARKIAEVTLEQLDPKVELEYSIAGKTYRPNLVPEGRIRINYSQTVQGTDYITGTTFLFGKKNDQYRLIFSAPS